MNTLGVDKSWTLFLDRDGVINERIFGGYVTTIDDFEFKKGVLESIPIFSSKFGQIIVVTNQQCIAKGIITSEQLEDIHSHMKNEIERYGGKIELIFVASEKKGESPFHRKPYPTMALFAKEKIPSINFNKSVMVGDTDSDIEFGKKLGMKTVLILSKEVTKSTPDISIQNLGELCDYL
jgi:D-glycero-D-manno-heptose 1,7-bisphosphate phosphatase